MAPEGPVSSLDEVLDHLERIMGRCRDEPSRLGYFPAIYHSVTARVKEGVETGFFDDGPRMAELDVAFANRYLTALYAFWEGQGLTRSWQVACRAASAWRPAILQHLLLGINAHINLDLGIAAARTVPGPDLADLRGDFDRINEILAGLIDQLQGRMNEVSPAVGLLDLLGGRWDEEVARFSIEVARTQAWWFAVELAPLDEEARAAAINARDVGVARFARRVILTPGWLTVPLLPVRLAERAPAPAVIDALARIEAPSLEEVEDRLAAKRA